MAVPEPGTVPEQRGPDDSEPELPRPRRSPRRLRKILLTGLLAGVLGAVGAIGYGFIWYDQATKLDRSAPDVAVDNYLRALLVERDDTAASLFACRDSPALDEIRAFLGSIEERERQLKVTVTVSWGQLAVERADGTATVGTDIRRTAEIDGVLQSLLDPWRFRVEDRDGWRVCAAAKAS